MSRKYRGHLLTDEQKDFAAENIFLVYWYLDKKLLNKGKIFRSEIDEVTGYLLWQYCMAVETFDPDKGNAFSTYAFRALHSGFCRYKDLTTRFQSRYVLTDFRFDDEDSHGDKQIIVEPEWVDNGDKEQIGWEQIKPLFDLVRLDPIERQIVYFYYNQRFSYSEIGEMLDYTGESIRLKMRGVIKKLREAVEDRDIILEDFIEV